MNRARQFLSEVLLVASILLRPPTRWVCEHCERRQPLIGRPPCGGRCKTT